MGSAGILGGWALQGYYAAGHCRDILRLGTAGVLDGWALQGYLVVGHYRDTLRLGTAGIFGGWALQGYLVVGHESQLPVGRGQPLLQNLTTPQRGRGTILEPKHAHECEAFFGSLTAAYAGCTSLPTFQSFVNTFFIVGHSSDVCFVGLQANGARLVRRANLSGTGPSSRWNAFEGWIARKHASQQSGSFMQNRKGLEQRR